VQKTKEERIVQREKFCFLIETDARTGQVEKNQEQCRVMEVTKSAAVVWVENSKVQEHGR